MKSILLVLSVLFLSIAGFSQSMPSFKMEPFVEYYQQQEKPVVVVNFWSTWCKPCIDEIPHFLEEAERRKDSAHFIFASLDTRKLHESGDLDKYVKNKNWKSDFVWINETNADYYCPLIEESWSGVIPVTLVYNTRTGKRLFFEEALEPGQLNAAIEEILESD